MSNWIYIDDLDVNNSVNQIHVDTRDFHCLLKDDHLDLRDAKHPEITRVLHNQEYLLHESKVKEFIKNLETITGGKGSWRMMNFNNVPTKLGWFKYVRLYRVRGEYFVVCEGSDIPVIHSLMNSENLQSKYINFIKQD